MGNESIIDSNGIARGVGQNAIYMTAGFGVGKSDDKFFPKDPLPNTNDVSSEKWSPWFDDNDFPKTLLDKLKKLSVGFPALERNADYHFGQGLITYRKEVIDGKIVKTPALFPEFEEWSEAADFNNALADIVCSLEYWYWTAPLLIKNKANDKINRVDVLDTSMCRLSTQEGRQIKKLYYSANWPTPTSEQYTEYDILQRNQDAFKDIKAGAFVHHMSYGSYGNIFYPLPNYYTVFANGWVDVAISVPKFKKAIFTNQMTVKYEVIIPIEYFLVKYKDWDDMTDEKRKEKFDALVLEIDTFLTGEDNAGKIFAHIKGYDSTIGRDVPGFEIKPIENKLNDRAHLPDATAANHEILFAMENDPSLAGASEQNKMGAGSGSDKRVAGLNKQITLRRVRNVSLSICYLLKRLNNWPSEMQFDYIDIDASATMDKNPTGKETQLKG